MRFRCCTPRLDGRSDLAAGQCAQLHAAARRAHWPLSSRSGGRLLGTVTRDSVDAGTGQAAATSLISALVPGSSAAPRRSPVSTRWSAASVQSPLALPVVDAAGNYLGAVTQTQLLQRFAQDEADHV
jgi:hypothetical protein